MKILLTLPAGLNPTAQLIAWILRPKTDRTQNAGLLAIYTLLYFVAFGQVLLIVEPFSDDWVWFWGSPDVMERTWMLGRSKPVSEIGGWI